MSGAYRLLIASGLLLTGLVTEAAAMARADVWTQHRPNATLYPHLPTTARTPPYNPPAWSPQWGRNNLTTGGGSNSNNYNANTNNNNNHWQRNNTAPQYPGNSWQHGQQTPWTRYNQTHPYIQTPGAVRGPNSASTPQPNRNIGQQYPGSGGGGSAGFQPAANWAARPNSTRQATPQPNRNAGWGGAAGFGGQSDNRSPQQPGGYQPQSWGARPSNNGTAGFGGNWNAPGSNTRASTPPPFQPHAGGWGAPGPANFGGQQPCAPRPNSTGPMPPAPTSDKTQWNAGGSFQPGWASEANGNAGSRTPGLAPIAPSGGNNQWSGGSNRQWSAGGAPQWGATQPNDNSQPRWAADPATNTGPSSSGSVPLAPIGSNSPWNGGGNTQGGARAPLAPLDGGGGAAWNGGQAGLSYSGGHPQPPPNGPNTNPYANLFN